MLTSVSFYRHLPRKLANPKENEDMTKTETSLELWQRLKSEQLRIAIGDEKRRKSRENETALERFQRLYIENQGGSIFPGQLEAARRIRASMRSGDRSWVSLRPRGTR